VLRRFSRLEEDGRQGDAMTKKKLVFSLLLLLALADTSRAADGSNCMSTFYQNKDLSCIDATITDTAKSGRRDNPALVGFFAEIFNIYPQEKSRLLRQDVPPAIRVTFIEALYEAGLREDAQTYATANGFATGFNNLQKSGLAPLKQLKPIADPRQNDVLIGGYMASGNIEHIKRILENFSSADDGMVADALRLAMMQGKFGPSLAPPGREKVIVQTACEKYECKKDVRQLMRAMTLSSAFWAIRSLSQQDAGIKKTFAGFFESDPRLKQILIVENTAFSNYLTTLALFAAIKDKPGIETSLSIYEKLGSAKDAVDALATIKKN
jgi:hypothetical protein